MEVRAYLRNLRIAPRKIRLLADLIRNKKVSEAENILDFIVKKGSRPLRKLLDSAVANAKNNFQLKEETLFISKITIDEGRKLKRWRARSRGRAAAIQKKTSHISLILEGEKEGVEEKKGKISEKEELERVARLKSKRAETLPRKKREEFLKPRIKKKGWKKVFRRKAF